MFQAFMIGWHSRRIEKYKYTFKASTLAAASACALGRIGGKRALGVLLLTADPFDTADSDLRAAAVASLGDLGDMEVLDTLIERLLNDRHYRVRESAAKALGKLGDKRAVEPLIKVCKEDDGVEVCVAAITSLGQLGDSRANGPLIDEILNFRNKVEIIAAATKAVVQLKKINIEEYGGIENVPLSVLLAGPDSKEDS